MSKTIRVPCRPSFELGPIVATPGALAATTDEQRRRYLARHSIGDWGHVCREDWEANDAAVRDGGRILSAYPLDIAKPCEGFGDNTLWIITEADRSVTTFLLGLGPDGSKFWLSGRTTRLAMIAGHPLSRTSSLPRSSAPSPAPRTRPRSPLAVSASLTAS